MNPLIHSMSGSVARNISLGIRRKPSVVAHHLYSFKNNVSIRSFSANKNISVQSGVLKRYLTTAVTQDIQTEPSIKNNAFLPSPLTTNSKPYFSATETPTRTHYCGSISGASEGSEVTLCGWVTSKRIIGKLIFVVLRDMYGSVQLVHNSGNVKEGEESVIAKALDDVTLESIIAIRGKVQFRPPEEIRGFNEALRMHGEVEVDFNDMMVLNTAPSQMPFDIRSEKLVNENLRLKYRFIDLRRPALLNNIVTRSKVAQVSRNYFFDHGFTEIETPTLFKATPECGAKEFLVPTRQKGKFYSLPQSPQQYKQTLMSSGIDKYFQLARCYRDEGIMADRQPEFTQIDLEMAYAKPSNVYSLIEGLLSTIWTQVLDHPIVTPFPHISFNEAMSRYGSDKPDTRYAMELRDISDIVRESKVKLFHDAIHNKGHKVKAINIKKMAGINSEEAAKITEETKRAGAEGVLMIKVQHGDWKSPIQKHLSSEEQRLIKDLLEVEDGDLVLMSVGEHLAACNVLGRLRVYCAAMMRAKGLMVLPPDQYNFLWTVDFPLFTFENNTLVSTHNPFTSPVLEDIPLLTSSTSVEDLLKVRALHYDVVLNGVEIGGGSIRCHNPELQKLIFDKLNLSTSLFNHLLEALRHGCPPHGGLAIGFDRLIAIICGASSLREVIAFPKTTTGNELMTGSPAEVKPSDLVDFGLVAKEESK